MNVSPLYICQNHGMVRHKRFLVLGVVSVHDETLNYGVPRACFAVLVSDGGVEYWPINDRKAKYEFFDTKDGEVVAT